MKIKAILAILGLAFALPAMAQKSTSGPYVGASVGQSTSSDFCFAQAAPCKDQDVSWKMLGGYQFNSFLGVEFGFSNLGDYSNPNVPATAKAQAMEIVGVATYNINSTWGILGKVGGARSRVRGSDTAQSFNVSSTDVTYGFGVQWNLMDQVALRAELQRYPRIGGANIAAASAARQTDIDVWSVGFIFRFP